MFNKQRKKFWQWRAQQVSRQIENLEQIQKAANALPRVKGIHDVFEQQLRNLRYKKLAITVRLSAI